MKLLGNKFDDEIVGRRAMLARLARMTANLRLGAISATSRPALALALDRASDHRSNGRYRRCWFPAALAGSSAMAFSLFDLAGKNEEDVQKAPESKKRDKSGMEAGLREEGLPEYSKEEVAKHDTEAAAWVTYKVKLILASLKHSSIGQNGVYDITEMLPYHPGAKNVLMAAGDSVEPFWEIYPVHKKNQQVS